jgi:hypothetical protein
MKADTTILSQKPRDTGDGTESHLQKESTPLAGSYGKTLDSIAQETAIYTSYHPLNMTKPDFTLCTL